MFGFVVMVWLAGLPALAQQGPTVLFNFDSTRVAVNLADLLPVLQRENRAFPEAARKAAKRDTVLLDGYTLHMGKYYDTLTIELHNELFLVLDQKKGKVTYKGKPVTAFETKKARIAKYGRKYFVGIYYYDADTRKHVLTRRLYQRQEITPFPDF